MSFNIWNLEHEVDLSCYCFNSVGRGLGGLPPPCHLTWTLYQYLQSLSGTESSEIQNLNLVHGCPCDMCVCVNYHLTISHTNWVLWNLASSVDLIPPSHVASNMSADCQLLPSRGCQLARSPEALLPHLWTSRLKTTTPLSTYWFFSLSTKSGKYLCPISSTQAGRVPYYSQKNQHFFVLFRPSTD